jgi:hypothetical protein
MFAAMPIPDAHGHGVAGAGDGGAGAADVLNAHGPPGVAGAGVPDRPAEGLSGMYTGLAKAWDRMHGLRIGERAVATDDAVAIDAPRTAKGCVKKVEAKKWGFSNTVTEAYDLVGRDRASMRVGSVGATKRVLDLVAGASCILQETLDDASSEKINAMQATSGFGTRCFDSTPIRCFFGTLSNQLAGFAKYLWKDETTTPPRWRLVPLDEFQQLKGHKFTPKWGVIDLLALNSTLHLRSSACATTVDGSFLTPPCILTRSNASTLYNACESVAPAMNVEHLKTLVSKRGFRCFLLEEMADSCKSNLRKVAQTQEDLSDVKNIFHVLGLCVVHIMRNIICGQETAVVCDLYALEVVAHLPRHYNSMVACLRG